MSDSDSDSWSIISKGESDDELDGDQGFEKIGPKTPRSPWRAKTTDLEKGHGERMLQKRVGRDPDAEMVEEHFGVPAMWTMPAGLHLTSNSYPRKGVADLVSFPPPADYPCLLGETPGTATADARVEKTLPTCEGFTAYEVRERLERDRIYSLNKCSRFVGDATPRLQQPEDFYHYEEPGGFRGLRIRESRPDHLSTIGLAGTRDPRSSPGKSPLNMVTLASQEMGNSDISTSHHGSGYAQQPQYASHESFSISNYQDRSFNRRSDSRPQDVSGRTHVGCRKSEAEQTIPNLFPGTQMPYDADAGDKWAHSNPMYAQRMRQSELTEGHPDPQVAGPHYNFETRQGSLSCHVHSYKNHPKIQPGASLTSLEFQGPRVASQAGPYNTPSLETPSLEKKPTTRRKNWNTSRLRKKNDHPWRLEQQ